MADIVQAKYETLLAITTTFTQQAVAVEDILENLARCTALLRDGGWEGQGADAFFAEMDGEVRPATRRLIAALHCGGTTTTKIGAVLRGAEEEAARLFAGEGEGQPSQQGTVVPFSNSTGDLDPVGNAEDVGIKDQLVATMGGVGQRLRCCYGHPCERNRCREGGHPR